MRLLLPPTATSVPEWIRKAAAAVNRTITDALDLAARVTSVEAVNTAQAANITAISGQITALAARATALELRATALEGYRSLPFEPLASAPSSPAEGRTYYDTTLHKARTWNGTAWQDLF